VARFVVSVEKVTAVDIVLPCLDEAAALPWVLRRIPAGARAIVVDNGSRDGSAQIAAEYGAVVIECRQRGYGAACHAGLLAASAEFVAVCDCDATLDPSDALRFVELLRMGADLVVARRIPTGRDAWTLTARLANVELARRVRRCTGVTLRDIGPLRVARRTALLTLPIADRRCGYPVETVLRAAEADWTIAAADVSYAPRLGRSKVTGTLRGSLRAVRDMSAVLAT
jgi:glycosyltransferase involved in cell wall biosynthesis